MEIPAGQEVLGLRDLQDQRKGALSLVPVRGPCFLLSSFGLSGPSSFAVPRTGNSIRIQCKTLSGVSNANSVAAVALTSSSMGLVYCRAAISCSISA